MGMCVVHSVDGCGLQFFSLFSAASSRIRLTSQMRFCHFDFCPPPSSVGMVHAGGGELVIQSVSV